MSNTLTDYEILCLSHLRWETTLFQRPQQLMSRFDAMGVGVFYASQWSSRRWLPARFGGEAGGLAGRAGRQILWRTWPMTPGVGMSHALERVNLRLFGAAVRRFVGARRKRPLVLWVYYPWAWPLVERFPYDFLVYDCMDPFAAFRATRGNTRLEDQERALLRRADVVFTGGQSLQAAKKGINPHTYCFPSGVDFDHFEQALDADLALPADVASLPRPILGYWGAVDERIDFDLVARLCRKWPGGSVVFLGPLVGMKEPPFRAPNFRYLGEKEYAQLPGYLAAFDVCLLPFRPSALTASLSPTKTPEYLAGGRPVVSTAIPDVGNVWGDVVSVADEAEGFLAAVEQALARPRPDRSLAEEARRSAKSWDDVARAMRERIGAVMRGE